jgi:hypothetical protein
MARTGYESRSLGVDFQTGDVTALPTGMGVLRPDPYPPTLVRGTGAAASTQSPSFGSTALGLTVAGANNAHAAYNGGIFVTAAWHAPQATTEAPLVAVVKYSRGGTCVRASSHSMCAP